MDNPKSKLNQSISASVEISIRLILLFLLIAWCLALLMPFVTPVLWAVIIAVSADPLFDWLNKRLGGKPALAATFVTILLLAVILVPAGFAVSGITEDVHRFGTILSSDNFRVPAPEPAVKSWPVIGDKIYSAWDQAYTNPEKFLVSYGDQIKAAGKWILKAALSLTGDLVTLMLSIIIAGVLLATPGTQQFTHRFFIKLVGERGEEFTSLAEKTIRNVTKGILGVAIIQSTMIGVILLLAGVPYAGILWAVCLILGIVQLPSLPVVLVGIVYLFSSEDTSTTMAIVWSALLVVASLSDNVLKPILLGKGAPVPMLVIFLGAIGGFIFSGFLGLFTGAIVLSLGYKLFISWVADGHLPDKN